MIYNTRSKEEQSRRNEIIAQIVRLEDNLELSRTETVPLPVTQENAIRDRLKELREKLKVTIP